jgi:hypothetical protein
VQQFEVGRRWKGCESGRNVEMVMRTENGQIDETAMSGSWCRCAEQWVARRGAVRDGLQRRSTTAAVLLCTGGANRDSTACVRRDKDAETDVVWCWTVSSYEGRRFGTLSGGLKHRQGSL